jgi:IS605 OrfB family transposase
MIKSTTSTLKFSNFNKVNTLHQVIDEYRVVVSTFIDMLWDVEDIPSKLEHEHTSQIQSWLSARMIQAAGKQASGIVRGTKTKQKRRLFMINKFIDEGKFRKAKKLQKIYDTTKVTKPEINHVCPELDSRFVNINLEENTTSFDGWIHFSSIGNKISLNIPFNKSKHFNKMLERGKIKSGVRLSKKQITFMFDIEDSEPKEQGEILGIDIGQNNTLACSNGFISTKNNHNHDLNSITQKLCKCTKDSKGFKRASEHRKNYINWTINQLNLQNVKHVKLENIKNLRKGRKTNRRLSHWTYTDIFDKVESKCLELGVQVTRISPTYTSKRCSECGWTRRSNRKGGLFKCGHCGYTTDADLNASKNIRANLKPIHYKKRQSLNIRTGFFWLEIGEEPVVPLVNKTLYS